MLSPDPVEHRRLDLGVRAPRVAILLDSKTNWRRCIELVETLTGIWGGGSYAIVPTDASVLKPVFWDLLNLYSPHLISAFPPTTLTPSLTECIFLPPPT